MNDEINPEFKGLLQRYLKGECSAQEKAKVENWYHTLDARAPTLSDSELLESLKVLEGNLDGIAPVQRANYHITNKNVLAFAACLLLIVSLGLFWFWSNTPVVDSAEITESYFADKKPGTDQAVLVLEDGTEVALDSIGSLYAFQQAYNMQQVRGDAPEKHVVKTPKGGQYHFTLPDGSKVWLNAESSITFPSEFSGDDRQVEVSGEVYLDVLANNKQKFLVHTNELTVEVLGTEFNVKAYPEDAKVQTTLIEGAVKLKSNEYEANLEPGYQSSYDKTSRKISHPFSVNVHPVTAWKDGWFSFESSPLLEVIGQIARWYNIEFEFDENMELRRFTGGMKRDTPLKEVLEILKVSGINFHVEDNTLHIKSSK